MALPSLGQVGNWALGQLQNLGTAAVNNAGSIALGGTGLLAAKEAYDRLGDIGEQANVGAQFKDPVTGEMVRVPGAIDIANAGLTQTQFQPYTVTTSTGSQFGYDPMTGQATNTLSSPEQGFQNMMFGNAQGFYNQAAMPTAGREQEVYDRLRAMQTPEEERKRMALEERLFTQGRGGVATNQYGGTPEQLALAKAQAEAQNQAGLMAMQQAQQEQLQQANLGNVYLGSSYIPQAQLSNMQQAAQMFPQLQQRGQLEGAGLFGEASMGGLEALLGAGLGQANLMGQVGTGLLSGALR